MTGLAASATARRPAPAVPPAERPLRILFLASAHNSLSQRVLVALTEARPRRHRSRSWTRARPSRRRSRATRPS